MTVDEVLDEVRKSEAIENRTFNSIYWDFSTANFNSVDKIIFTNCEFTGDFSFSDLKNEDLTIEFQNCSFKFSGVSYINTVNCFSISIINCFSQNSFLFIDCILGDLSINEITVKEISVISCKIEFVEISIKNNGSIDKIFIDSPELDELGIESTKNINHLRVGNVKKASIMSNFESVSFDVPIFDVIKFEALSEEDKELNPTVIKSFSSNDLNFSGHLTLQEIQIENFVLSNVSSSSGTIRLTEVFIDNAEFEDCSISSFYWNQVHFNKQLEIERCDFSGLKLTNVKWLTEKKLSNSFLDDKIKLLYGLRKKGLEKKDLHFGKEELMLLQYERDTYRQLKAASIANHNHIEALDFYRNEMRLYWKEIRINGGVTWYNRILVFLNRWVSDFGQNWWLPLVWMFILHTLIYFWIINFHFTASWTDFKNGGGQYFELLNPVHKTPEYITGFYVGLELLMRILNGFFIYHFIRATRKFSKL